MWVNTHFKFEDSSIGSFIFPFFFHISILLFFQYVTNVGSKVYFRTNKNAPNYRVIIIDFENPAEENWETLIPEHEKDVLDWVKCVNEDKILLCYIRDVKVSQIL